MCEKSQNNHSTPLGGISGALAEKMIICAENLFVLAEKLIVLAEEMSFPRNHYLVSLENPL
jgi:hypothetical protein